MTKTYSYLTGVRINHLADRGSRLKPPVLPKKYNELNKEQAVAYFERELEFTTNPGGAKAVVEGKRPNITIIDVRSAEAFAKGHIPRAINLSHKDFNNFDGDNDSFKGLRKDGYNYVYCYEVFCNLSQKAALKFAKQGYAVKELKGGFKSWEEHGYPIEK